MCLPTEVYHRFSLRRTRKKRCYYIFRSQDRFCIPQMRESSINSQWLYLQIVHKEHINCCFYFLFFIYVYDL